MSKQFDVIVIGARPGGYIATLPGAPLRVPPRRGPPPPRPAPIVDPARQKFSVSMT